MSKIPPDLAAKILFKANHQCSMCEKRRVQIHHIDEDTSNNNYENLIVLCQEHHEEAHIKTRMTRSISKEELLMFREVHYEAVSKQRENRYKDSDHQIDQLSEESLLKATMTAMILLEIDKIQEEFNNSNLSERADILFKLGKYSRHSNDRIAFEVFDLLVEASYQTRFRMDEELLGTICSMAQSFLPSYSEGIEESTIELAQQCIHIGESIAYDAFIHLNNFHFALKGLNLLKYVMAFSSRKQFEQLKNDVYSSFKSLESTLDRPERDDLEDAKQLLSEFKDDLHSNDMSYPMFSRNLMHIIYPDRY